MSAAVILFWEAPPHSLPQLVKETHFPHVRRKSGVCTQKIVEAFNLGVIDGYGSEEAEASDIVPTPADPHAAR